jgi:superfamily II DNA helicase RecQ
MCFRPEIFLHVDKCSEHYEQELTWLLTLVRDDSCTKRVIVYVSSIHKCQQIYFWLVSELDMVAYKNGVNAVQNRLVEMFHAHIDNESKDRIQTDFCRVGGTLKVLVSTIAFGMGVNIPNVSVVVHWGLPMSILQYWQEAGRCSRDGKTGLSVCNVFPRSTSKCTDEALKSLVKTSNKCVRVQLMEAFMLAGMDKSALEKLDNKQVCDNRCMYTCACDFCTCCTVCLQICNCPERLSEESIDIIEEYLYNY